MAEPAKREYGARKITAQHVAALVRAVPGADPAGAALDHHHEQFRIVHTEIDKLGGVTADPDWTRLVAAAEAVLSTKSKDLRIATALARAWWEGNGGGSNLVQSIALVDGLLFEHGPRVHPLDPDARRDALDLFSQWLVERWSSELPTRDEPTRTAVHAALRDLCAHARALVGESTPDLADCEALAESLAPLPPATDAPADDLAHEPADDADTTPTVTMPAATTPVPSPPSLALPVPAVPADAEAARALLRQLRERLVAAANLLRRSDPAAPLAYRLIRQIVWQGLDSLDLTPERLAWKPPTRRDTEPLERLQRAQNWPALLDAAETQQDASPLWLDLQRHAVHALGQLGLTAARRDVEHEVRGLLARLPALATRRFNDGTPLADATTCQWLAGLTASGDAPAASERPSDVPGLHAAAASAASGRERFLLRRELARLCVASGRTDVAIGLLAALRDEARLLAAWEPGLLADCLSELVRCGRTLGDGARARLDVDHALAELSAHDPPAALALGRDVARP